MNKQQFNFILIICFITLILTGCTTSPKKKILTVLPEPSLNLSNSDLPPPPPPPPPDSENNTDKNKSKKHELTKDEKLKMSVCYIIIALGDYKDKKLEDAIKHLDSAVLYNPDNPDAYYNRALIKYRLNFKNEACVDLEKAKELGKKDIQEIIDSFCGK